MPKEPIDSVRNLFIAYQSQISDTFTTREAREWYRLNRNTGFYSNLYMMILQPLQKEGRIIHITRGLWRITNLKEEKVRSLGLTTQWKEAVSISKDSADSTRQAILRDLDTEDEFEAYIASKLKGA